MKNFKLLILIVLLCGVGVVHSALGATIDVVSDDWGILDQNGYVYYNVASDGSAVVSFNQVYGLPVYSAVTLVADSVSSGSVFTGNYVQSGIKSVSFSIKSETDIQDPVGVGLVLKGSASGRIWRNDNISVSVKAGELILNSISFDRSAGWAWDGPGDLDALWSADLQDVALLGIRIAQKGSEAKTYSLDAFKLLDVNGGVVGAADLLPTRVLDFFATKYGVGSLSQITDVMKNTDSDGDGVSDWLELLAGTDPLNANSVFAVTLDDQSAVSGIVISWPCAPEGKYTILKTSNLIDGFSPILFGLTPTPEEVQAGVMRYNDATATEDVPYFYKVMKE